MATQAAADTPHSLPHSPAKKIPWWRTARAAKVGLSTLVLVIAGTLLWWYEFHPFVSTDDARVASTLVRVAASGVSGRIIAVKVEEGTRVKKDDILVELDHRIPQAQLSRAKAKNDLAIRELNRVEQLVTQRSLPPRDLDNAKAAAETAAAEYKLAEVALENTYLRSPFDGLVVQKLAEVGNILEAGQSAVTVADIDNAWISANIEETEIAPLSIGQPVAIHLDTGGTLAGKVSEIRGATASQFALISSDNGAGNFTKVVQRIPVKIALDDKPSMPMRVGQSVEIRVKVR